MSNGASLRLADVRDALTVVGCAAASDESTPFPLEVIELLKRLIGADRAGYVEYEVRPPNLYLVESPSLDLSEYLRAADDVVGSWPLRDYLGRRTVAARSLSETLTRRGRRKNPFHMAFSARVDVEDELKIWLPAPRMQARLFWLNRSQRRRDFSERERALCRLLAPHFAAHRRRWEQRRRPPTQLTDREAELLQLVAAGLTNREIAAQLVIATGTVRKHLDHIYDKLAVHTRTAAASYLHQASSQNLGDQSGVQDRRTGLLGSETAQPRDKGAYPGYEHASTGRGRAPQPSGIT